MNRFRKILLLILSLVLIVSTFTVVALATDEAGTPTLSTPYIRDNVVGSWEGETVRDGNYIGTGTSGKRPAYVYAEVSADGNKYAVYTPSPGKTDTGDMWYDTIGSLPSGNVTKEYTDANGETATKKVNKYNLADYPYVVYDFDIMSPTGNFGKSPALNSFSFRTHAYYYVDNEYGYNDSYKAGTFSDTGKTALDVPVSAVFAGLDDTPYNWQHVTIIAKAFYGSTTVSEEEVTTISFEIQIYVNGKLTGKTSTVANGEYFNGKLLEDIAFGYVRQSALKSLTNVKPLVDMTGYVGSDPTTWPDSDPSEWYEDKVAFDNPSFANYQSDWSFDLIAKESWERTKDNVPAKSQKSVASVTHTDGSIEYFADINSAVAAAAEGETVTLLADITTTVKIEKAIIVDAGMHYKLSGVDYLLGTHDFPHYSSTGMIAAFDATTGIYTFAEREGLFYIEWDPECEGECDCLKGHDHKFSFSGTGAVGMPILSVAGEKQTTYEIVNGYDVNFLGWSLTKGGEVVDLAALAPEEGSTVKLYPVYNAVQYNLQVIKSNGAVSYYKQEELEIAVANAGSNGRVKLMTDVYTECSGITFSHNLVIDLNGHTLNRCFVFGNVYEATSDGEGGYVYGDVATAVSNSAYFFRAGTAGVKLEITSDTGSGSLSTVSMKADTWKCGDEVVKRTALSTTGSVLLNSNEKGSVELYITGGVSVYSTQLFYQTYASTGNYVVNIDSSKYFFIEADAFPYTGSGNYKYVITLLNDNANTITVTDSLLCFPYNSNGDYFINLRTNGSGGDSSKTTKITFTNSDIMRTGYGWSTPISVSNTNGEFVDVVFDNCRVYDVSYSNFTESKGNIHNAINGSLYRYYSTSQESPQTTDEKHTIVAKNFKYIYTVPNLAKFAINTENEINTINFDLGTKEYSLTYTHIITRPVEVKWLDENGNVIKTEMLRPGVDSLVAPRYVFNLPDDDYRNVLAQWVDENGNPITDVLGLDGVKINWQDSYTFRPVKAVDDNTEYTGGIKDVLFNISFTSSFRYNLYLPERDTNITFGEVTLFEKGELVKINGVEYRAYSYVSGTVAAADVVEVSVKYSVGGVEYEQILKLNALIYADLVLSSSEAAEEKLAVGNMARFIMEARKATEAEVDEERFNAIFDAAGVQDYAEEYVGNGTIENLKDYIYSANYVIINGAASYKFTLTDAAYADVLNFTLNGKDISYTVGTEIKNEVEYTYLILENAKVYDIIDTLTVTVDGTELEATYSMLDNIEANPTEDLVKALYEFGIAAENYRAYLENL